MPFVTCFVDERTMQVMERIATMKGCAVHEVAEQELESFAVSQMPGGMPGMHWPNSTRFTRGDQRDEPSFFPFGGR